MTTPRPRPIGGAPRPGSVKKWVVKYSAEHHCWIAYPVPNGMRSNAGWAFSRWRDAYDYAHSGGARKRGHLA